VSRPKWPLRINTSVVIQLSLKVEAYEEKRQTNRGSGRGAKIGYVSAGAKMISFGDVTEMTAAAAAAAAARWRE